MLRSSCFLKCAVVAAVSNVEPLVTSFITDLEGDGIYFDAFVEHSKVLSRDPITRELRLRDGCRLVYGGDLNDKGAHDMRLCKELLTLKQKYPERVTFIIGNRDLQKHKFISMLHPSWSSRPIADHRSPYYMPTPGVAYADFLSKNGGLPHSEYNYLDWLVHHCYGAHKSLTTMRQEMYEESVLSQWKADGTRKSYADLRDELYDHVRSSSSSNPKEGAHSTPSFRQLHNFLAKHISEGEVIQMYKRIASPLEKSNEHQSDSSEEVGAALKRSSVLDDNTGIMVKYCEDAQLAAVHDGILFVHGAAKRNTIGYVPSLELEERVYAADEPLPGEVKQDMHSWVSGLNDFYRRALVEWKASPYFDPHHLETAIANGELKDGRFPKRGGGALFAYGHSKSCKGKSVVINSYFGDQKPPNGAESTSSFHDLTYVDMNTVTFLGLAGVSAVMTGHQPVSDVPLVISQPGLRVVCGDTSYCDGRHGRGSSVAEVLHNGQDGAIRIHGRLVDGAPYDFTVEEDGPRTVGRRLKGGWWVRAELPDGRFLVRRTKDRFFTHETRFLTLEELESDIVSTNGELSERSAVVGEDAPLPFSKADLRPLRNHEKSDPSIKTKRCCGTRSGGASSSSTSMREQ